MEDEVKEPAPKYNYISPQEYLAFDRASEVRIEYYDGQMLEMSGASKEHCHIAMNLYINVGYFLKGKNCQMLPSEMRISTPTHDTYMYPDASITCSEPILEDGEFDTLLNPDVIFEILSPSTQSIDKGRKFTFYKQIPSLKEYIMIDSRKRSIQLYCRQSDNSWKLEELKEYSDMLQIQAIDFAMAVSEIYANTGL